MGDQYISIVWNQRPGIPQRLPSLQHERPVHERRRPGRAPEPYSINFDTAVLKVDRIGQQLPRLLRLILKGPVMITSNHYFVTMGQSAQPAVEIFDIVQGPLTQTVTGMDQLISIRKLRNVPMQAVGVRDADDFHGSLPGRVRSSASSDQSMKGSSLMILRASSTPLWCCPSKLSSW